MASHRAFGASVVSVIALLGAIWLVITRQTFAHEHASVAAGTTASVGTTHSNPSTSAFTPAVSSTAQDSPSSAGAARAAAVRQELFAAIQPVSVSNCRLQRFGEAHDGGYLLCENLLQSVRSGYSYGISGYDGWGCDVSRQLHIPVHEYDCFDLRAPLCPDGNTDFHSECVGITRATEDGRPFDTLASQFARNGDAEKRLVMKIDVEGAEWDSFLLAPDHVFEHLDQLVVEFHGVQDPKFVAVIRRLKQFFYIAHVHYNNFSCDPTAKPFPAWAFEVLFVNKRIAVTDGSPAATGPGPFDAANNATAPDCQG